MEEALLRLRRAADLCPVAAGVACEALRIIETLPFEDGLTVESLAYSTLLAGVEFRRWRKWARIAPPVPSAGPPVRYERTGDEVSLILSDPANHNAFSYAMRDELLALIETCAVDPTRPQVTLKGEGRAFCTGGALFEFGAAEDLARAHLVRTEYSVTRQLYRLGERTKAVVHGAVIGSGMEMAAAAHRLEARGDAWFQLPELRMGLIPGAGGCVSVSRRIGRHRCCYLILSGKKLSARQALDWGLVDELVEL